MHKQTNFGGHGLSGFEDFAHFCLSQNSQNFMNYIVHGGQKIESTQKIHASRG